MSQPRLEVGRVRLSPARSTRTLLCFSAILLFVSLILAAEPQRASTIWFNYDKDSFSATGNWIPADPKDRPAFPSETEIDCSRNSMSCVEGTVVLPTKTGHFS